MKTIAVTEVEGIVLTDTVKGSLSDLKTEIGHTEKRELRADLKRKTDVLEGILKKLYAA